MDASNLNQIFTSYAHIGKYLIWYLLLLAVILGSMSFYLIVSPSRTVERNTFWVMCFLTLGLMFGFSLICWLNFEIYRNFSLKIPNNFVGMINYWIKQMSIHSKMSIPPYDPLHPPRYKLPPWLEEERYCFWFLSFGIMALIAWWRTKSAVIRRILEVLYCDQVLILTLVFTTFIKPLPNFVAEIKPWVTASIPMAKVELFIKLYPRLVFYYNAPYMWGHPPLLFISYAALTVFFAACVSMLVKNDTESEYIAYSYAKPAYLCLTVGMLLGLPWALEAWGPNWWWDPKIASSIMMWVVFSTYLHARLYLSRKGMWKFVAWLGILCFIAMIFTYLASYLFPGEHSF